MRLVCGHTLLRISVEYLYILGQFGVDMLHSFSFQHLKPRDLVVSRVTVVRGGFLHPPFFNLPSFDSRHLRGESSRLLDRE